LDVLLDGCVLKSMEKAGNEEIKSLSPGNGGHFTSRKLPQINTGDGDHGMMELNHDGINYSSIGEGVYWKIFHTGCMLTNKFFIQTKFALLIIFIFIFS
jgi:hypothetical protein